MQHTTTNDNFQTMRHHHTPVNYTAVHSSLVASRPLLFARGRVILSKLDLLVFWREGGGNCNGSSTTTRHVQV